MTEPLLRQGDGVSVRDAEQLARDLDYARQAIELAGQARYEKLRNLLLYASEELTQLRYHAELRGDEVI